MDITASTGIHFKHLLARRPAVQYLDLFRNDGDLNFSDVSHISRIARSTTQYVGWGDAFYDIDNDGWLDLIAVNGHVYPQVDQANFGVQFREPGQLFLNQRDGTFHDVSVPGWGGADDSASETRSGDRRFVQRRRARSCGGKSGRRAGNLSSQRWTSAITGMGFELAGTKSNKLALNARVKVIASGLLQTDEVRSSGSYLSQSDLRLHFGLGDHRRVDKVEIACPSGGTETLANLEADRSYNFPHPAVTNDQAAPDC